MAYRVLIVEDQEMPRQLFEIYIRESGNYELANTLTNAAVAVDLCRAGGIDLVLMDVCTAFGSNGLDAAEDIKREFPEIKVIIVTSMPEFSWLERAKQIGVDSFWYKEAQKDTILSVCDRTMAGGHIYPDETPQVSIGAVTNHDFTERELQILRELITGDSNAEIGDRLGVSAGTVKRHVENMLKKTGFHTRTELVAEAGRLGIVIRFS
ncbi:MAG: response regulator transcription factor [Lachnospiraceae bacterium]|jgi:two-component system vancomycin resistance associated response regulator VraR|nr:response regulator transcription factor [Lachnospiraceae bacterium]